MQLNSELADLKLYKSSAQDEHKILLEELAKRRIKQKSMAKKIKKLEARLHEYENADLTDYIYEDIPKKRQAPSVKSIAFSDVSVSERELVKHHQPKKRPQSRSSQSVVFFQAEKEEGEACLVDRTQLLSKRPQSAKSAVSFQESVSNYEKKSGQSTLTNSSAPKRPQSGHSVVSFQDTECATDNDNTAEIIREENISCSSEGSWYSLV
jgi:hypothetical protein